MYVRASPMSYSYVVPFFDASPSVEDAYIFSFFLDLCMPVFQKPQSASYDIGARYPMSSREAF